MPTKPPKGRAPQSRVEAARSGPTVPLFAIVLAGLVAVVLIAMVVIAVSGGDDPGELATGDQAFGPVEVDGEPLVTLPPAGDDPAVGQPAPALVGETTAGDPVSITPGEDGPMVLAFVAHWCPHCQVEVPHIVELADDDGAIDGVPAVAVVTGSDPSRDNYPPGEWLAREGWQGPSMVDSDPSDPEQQPGPLAARAYGLTSYPFLVAIDADGTVVGRTVGEKSDDQLRDFFALAAA